MTNFRTADLCDEYSEELSICELEMKSYGKYRSFSGPIATVRVFEDNYLVKEALETVAEGTVVVVDGAGSRRRALMGDMLGAIAENSKVAGVIINGSVRDVADMAKQEIGVKALGTTPMTPIKQGEGERDVIVTFGGVEWIPGHYAYADEDGIVVCARKLV